MARTIDSSIPASGFRQWQPTRSFLARCLAALLLLTMTLFVAAVMRTQLLWALGLLSGRPGVPHNSRPVLSFSASGSFKISIFEDLHFGEDEFSSWAPRADKQTLRVMSYLLDAERPDFVVLNGDLVTGDNTYLHNSTDYIDLVVSRLVAADTPWASTYGNHDINYNSSTSAFLARERRYRLSHTNQMVFDTAAGTSNYYLPIYRTPTSTVPVLILYFFDSRGGHAFQQLDAQGEPIAIPGTVDASVVTWFRKTSSIVAAQYRRHIPSLAFVHIPTSHMADFSRSSDGVDPHYQPGLGEEPIFSPQTNNSAFVNALLDTEGLLAVFTGHQHGNDWCMGTKRNRTGHGDERPPLFACFGRHTGYGGYGNWERGARQVVLDVETLAGDQATPEIETWVRLERGGVSGHVMLNATYGSDKYAKVRKSYTRLGEHAGDVVDGESIFPQ